MDVKDAKVFYIDENGEYQPWFLADETTIKFEPKKNQKKEEKKKMKRSKKNVRYFPRRLARSIAKANMERAGVQHINSLFASNWRDWVFVR